VRLKPGWYLLFLTLFYAVLATVAWQRSERKLAECCVVQAVAAPSGAERPVPTPPAPASQKKEERAQKRYVLPLPGACLPKDPALLPNAPRHYRKGVSYGFVFTGDGVCVPVVYGTGVVAANDGEVVKADHDYAPLSPEEYAALLEAVKDGATPEEMDRLRGREVWIRHPDGRISVYAHLDRIAPWVQVGTRVERGDWIGNVGNSGTGYEVEGTREGARLLFELWEGEVDPEKGRFFGQGLAPEEVLEKARAFFEHLPE